MAKVSEDALKEMQEDLVLVCQKLRDLSEKFGYEARGTEGWDDEQANHFRGVMTYLSQVLLFPIEELEDELESIKKYAEIVEKYHDIQLE